MENKERLRGLESCESLVCYVLKFGMDHINNLKVKELRMLLWDHFGLEILKGIPNKVELVEAVTYLFRRYWESILQRVCVWGEGNGGVGGNKMIWERDIDF